MVPSYARLLRGEDDSEFMFLDEMKPAEPEQQQQPVSMQTQPHHNNVYYDLQPNPQSSCTTAMYLGDEQTPTCSSVAMETSHIDSILEHIPKKRKAPSSYHDCSDFDDDTGDDAKSAKTDDNKKQNHSEIEKRRRDKMNLYITELSSMVPMCHAMSRKLDKLTVLRMAVQHLKSIRGAVHSYTEGHYKPSFLSDHELKQLILQAAEGFLFVVGCDRGRILYVSESVSQTLNYPQADLLGQSWFDILHPKDVAKVKEQLSSSDLSPRERLIDAKNRRYSVIHCTGYLKSLAPSKMGLEDQEGEGEGEACNLSCLVAVGRVLPNHQSVAPPRMHHHSPNIRTVQFISRHALDGKILFIDQRATLVLGFLPQELLGTSMYEYYHPDDITSLAESHKAALQNQGPVQTQIYRFRRKDGSFVRLQSEWKAFRNPWTKDIECLIAKNKLQLTDVKVESSHFGRSEHPSQSQSSYDFFSNNNNNNNNKNNNNNNNTKPNSSSPVSKDMTRLISTHVEASTIGRQIAEEVMDQQRKSVDCTSPLSVPPSPARKDTPKPTAEQSQVVSSVVADLPSQSLVRSCNSNTSTNSPGSDVNTSYSSSVRNNVTLSSIANANDSGDPDEVTEMIEQADSPTADVQSLNNHGNDEAAMAVIMSLLEADAGLGGPVDFTGLPWPLP